MSREASLLSAAIRDRDAFADLKKYCDKEDFSAVGRLILAEVADYYERDAEAMCADKDMIVRRLSPKLHNESQVEAVEMVLDQGGTESIPNVLHELLELKRNAASAALTDALLANDHKKVRQLMERYQTFDNGLTDNDKDRGVRVYTGLSFDELSDDRMLKPEFELMPRGLNERLEGGAWRQAHIGIFARPEYGKSLFSINMACGLLRRGHKVLYVGNEDASKAMRLRFLTNLSNRTKMEVMDAPEESLTIATAAGMQLLSFVEAEAGSIGLIDELTREYRPDCVFVDQLRNLTDRGDEGLTTVLEVCGKGARRIAKRHDVLMVSVTQAGETATNKPVLTPEDVEYSKTGFHASLDLLIGVGANKTMLNSGLRMVNLPKNKISNRHECFSVKFDPTKSKVLSVG